ncbi:MAG: hypothetical protein RIB93_14885 [Coleofasciculus sp. D1-CHI-01]|uniref:hypothetical protein n=1 Tax=Coleofasciculus sp. D1-CHI-01 TaxID=3068482 RepID=UPI0032F1EC78
MGQFFEPNNQSVRSPITVGWVDAPKPNIHSPATSTPDKRDRAYFVVALSSPSAMRSRLVELWEYRMIADRI